MLGIPVAERVRPHDAALDACVSELGSSAATIRSCTLRRLMGEMYARFEYSPRSTRVDSPIDEALATRSGVCQDFAHIFIALVRPLGIPARYVSGYLFHDDGAAAIARPTAPPTPGSRCSCPISAGSASIPTNNLVAEDRHIRVAIGRDYADVPPTRGVYKGVSVGAQRARRVGRGRTGGLTTLQ